MLTFHEDRRQVWIHRNADGTLRHEFNFDPRAPLPWRAEVDVAYCGDCLPEYVDGPSPDNALMSRLGVAIGAELDKVHATLTEAHHASALARMRDGAKTITETELLARYVGVVGSTRLQQLRKDRLFPEPMTAGGRNIWIESDAADAVAHMVARDTEAGAKKRAPLNRHQRRA